MATNTVTKMPQMPQFNVPNKNPCVPDPCSGNGQCSVLQIGTEMIPRCTCFPPFFGEKCDQQTQSATPVTVIKTPTTTLTDLCALDPCQGRGNCTVTTYTIAT